MARYRLESKSYIDDRMYDEGSEIAVADDAIPGPHWTPLDLPAKRAYAARLVDGKFVGPKPSDLDIMPFLTFPEADATALLAELSAIDAAQKQADADLPRGAHRRA